MLFQSEARMGSTEYVDAVHEALGVDKIQWPPLWENSNKEHLGMMMAAGWQSDPERDGVLRIMDASGMFAATFEFLDGHTYWQGSVLHQLIGPMKWCHNYFYAVVELLCDGYGVMRLTDREVCALTRENGYSAPPVPEQYKPIVSEGAECLAVFLKATWNQHVTFGPDEIRWMHDLTEELGLYPRMTSALMAM